MNRDPNLLQETEQFSFIRSLAIFPAKNKKDQKQSLPSMKNESKSHKLLHFSATNSKAIADQASSSLTTKTKQDNHNTIDISCPLTSPLTISNSWYCENNFSQRHNSLTTVIILPELGEKKTFKKAGFHYYLDRILLLGAGGYLCFIFWLVFLSHNPLFPLAFLSRQEKIISQADVNFINYMKQSLEMIDHNLVGKQTNSETKAKETVYVPVYTPSSNNSLSNNHSQVNQNLPLLPPPPTPNQLVAMNPPVSAIPIKTPTPPSEAIDNKTTAIKTDNNYEAIKSTSQIIDNSETAAATIKVNSTHVLIGVMELNENSAALFKINGITQRIWLGEKIENTGWVLKSVENQKVIISREGKSLTLNVGEYF